MDFDLQPTLSGELLELRPLAVSDFDALYAAASDPLIWEHHPERDRHRREVFVVGEHNLRSQMALRKIGATFLRRMDDSERPDPLGARVVFVITRR